MSTNQGYVYRHRVPPADAGASVLAYHVERFRHSDEAAWQRALDEGRVRLNGRVAAAEERLAGGDELEFHRAPWREPEAPLGFAVVLEDEYVLVVDKPAGLQVLPAGPFSAHTLLQLVRDSAPERAQSSPVHRLGRGTSGLVLFGKTSAARAELSRQLRECSALKTYFGLVAGTGLPRSALAAHPIGRVPVGAWQTFAVAADGLPSRTRVRVLRRDEAARRSLVAAQPITGRPNQIRIHLAALGAPLVGDPLFAPGGGPSGTAKPAEGGYFLHAASLGFVHPATGRWTKLRSRPDWL